MINLLDKEIIDKIAAGEVVDRPNSIVKELVENSIDSGAAAITVEIKNGGESLIRVTDNGMGIAGDQCVLAFTRHATSKIKTSLDLNNIITLGFRGEALSSIAAISKVELITKIKDSVLGTHVLIEGGEILDNTEIAAPDGTSIFVRDIFYNTPARKKFLKGKNAENALIEDTLVELALSRCDISFRLIAEGKEKLFTSGSNSLKNTILEIFGINTASSLLETEAIFPDYSISGYIGKSILNRGNRGGEHFFVNNRYVKSNTLMEALETGYIGYAMQHRFPFCVLFFTFKAGNVDVNVHPQKMEVRFNNPLELQDNLKTVIQKRLIENEDIEKISLQDELGKAKDTLEYIGYEPFEEIARKEALDNAGNSLGNNQINTFDNPIGSLEENSVKPSGRINDNEKVTYEQEVLPFLSEKSKPEHKIIGQVFGTYWLIEFNNALYIIDQHAAHEKVLFERTMKLIRDKKMYSQLISPAIIVSLNATEEESLNKNMESFESLGYKIENFGARDYKITGIPASLPSLDPKGLFLETIQSGISVNALGILERVASLSCKAAVKGNHDMSIEEIDTLVNELLTLKNPYHCPHGRPTMISFTRYELDKKFKRIV